MSNLHKNLYFLKLIDIYKLELDKFMFALHNNRLPNIFYDSLTKSRYMTITPDNKQKMFILNPQLIKTSVEKLYYIGEGVYGKK